jgi:hypothetical protein
MVDHAGNGWAALGWDVNPMLIGIALAGIAEIAGDVDSALRWDADPMLIAVMDCTLWVRQQNNGQWVDH